MHSLTPQGAVEILQDKPNKCLDSLKLFLVSLVINYMHLVFGENWSWPQAKDIKGEAQMWSVI